MEKHNFAFFCIKIYTGLTWSRISLLNKFAPASVFQDGTAHITRMKCAVYWIKRFLISKSAERDQLCGHPSLWWFTKNFLYHATVKNMQALRQHVMNAAPLITRNML